MISRKTIIISVCVIILLVGAYVFLSFSGNNQPDIDKPEQNVVSTKLEPIFEVSQESIESLSISKGDVSYEFYKTEDGWKVRGFENIVFNQANVFSTIFDYVNLVPMLVVDKSPADTALYGFDKPVDS